MSKASKKLEAQKFKTDVNHASPILERFKPFGIHEQNIIYNGQRVVLKNKLTGLYHESLPYERVYAAPT